MKKFILLSLVSIFFYSVPGYTAKDGEEAKKELDEALTPAAEPTGDSETEQMVLQAGAFATKVINLLGRRVNVLKYRETEEIEIEVTAFHECIHDRCFWNPVTRLERKQGGITKREIDEEGIVIRGRLQKIDHYLRRIRSVFGNELRTAEMHLNDLLEKVRSSGIRLSQTREKALDVTSEEALAAVTSVETPADSKEAELQAHNRIVTAKERSREAELQAIDRERQVRNRIVTAKENSSRAKLRALCDQIITANQDGELLRLEEIFDISRKVVTEEKEYFAKMERTIVRMYQQEMEYLQRVMALLHQGTEETEQAVHAVAGCYGPLFQGGAVARCCYANMEREAAPKSCETPDPPDLWDSCQSLLRIFQASTEEMMERCSRDMATITSLQKDLEEDKIQRCSIPKAVAPAEAPTEKEPSSS